MLSTFEGTFFTGSKEELLEAKKELTITPYSSFSEAPSTPFPIYKENKDLRVPLHWAIDKGCVQFPPEQRVRLSFQGSLDPARGQVEDAETIIKTLQENRGCIHVAACGFGKTTLTLYVLAKLQLKAIVVVNKGFLLEQWKDRIALHLPGARVGTLTAGKAQGCEEADIILATVQTLAKHQLKSKVSMLVVDEAHLMCTRVFASALLNVGFCYSLGLSATPSRTDGCWHVIELFLGKPATKRERSLGGMDIKIVSCDTSYVRERLLRNGKVDFTNLLEQITTNPARTRKIAECITGLLKDDHNILVLSDRRAHLQEVEALLLAMGVSGEDIGYYVGGRTQEQLEEAASCSVILGTYSMASTGLDIPSLTCLVMASPRSSILQSLGRVQRNLGGRRPLVVDFSDQVSVLKAQASRRRALYKKQGWTLCIETKPVGHSYGVLV